MTRDEFDALVRRLKAVFQAQPKIYLGRVACLRFSGETRATALRP